ncbi:MAG TPA: tetratricopeptide repeat protein [Candidatus Methylacidiphilales bacterium]|nr:tetratricopeptide repeat protein [Candidatus Methylacidiphilales bacterium]
MIPARQKFLSAFIPGFILSALWAWSQQPAPAPADAANESGSANTWIALGIANGKKGDWDKALSAFDQALQIDPKSAAAYENRGIVFSHQQKMDAAIADFDKALELNPKIWDAYYRRGTIKGQKGDFDGAIADFDHALELNPNDALAYYNRGHAKYFKGDLDGALSDINHAINLNPDDPYSHFIRGLIHRAQGDAENAAVDFQKSANDGYLDGALWLWIVKSENGKRGVARENLSFYLGRAEQAREEGWPAPIADFFLEKSTQDELMAAIPKGAAGKNELCEAWFYSGIVKHFTGDNAGALKCYQQAIATGAIAEEEMVEAHREITKLQALQ